MKTVLQSEQKQTTRLFSHLEFDGNKLNHQPGSLLGSTALIAGTTIGAGILALDGDNIPEITISESLLLLQKPDY